MPAEEIPFDPDDPDNWKSLDYIEEVVQDKIEQQNDLWDVVDGRLRLILGVIGIVFAAVLGFQRGPSQLEFPVVFLAVIAVLLFLSAAIAAAVVYWPMDFIWPPHPQALRDEYTMQASKNVRMDGREARSGRFISVKAERVLRKAGSVISKPHGKKG